MEDDPVFQTLLSNALSAMQPQWALHTAATAGEALAACLGEGQRFELAVVDLGLPDGDGLEVIEAFSGRFPDVPVLVISSSNDAARLLRAVRAGAAGYVVKGDPDLTVSRAIAAALAGEAPVSTSMTGHLLRLAGRESPSALPQGLRLSARETELLGLLAGGRSYVEAAAAMGVALSTVQTVIRRLYRKLGVHSQAQAVLRAKALGLIP